jgi:RNA polymerase sigma-70 factor, ECF subfamily
MQDELELSRKLARGDEAALSAIYGQWQAPLYRFAWHMTASTSTAEEVVQEVFLQLIEKPRGFDPLKGSLGAYLFGIARNVLLRRLRNTVVSDSLDDSLDEPVSQDLDPWSALSHQQLVETVRAAVVSLPVPYREAVALCDLEEFAYDEAAAALDCPIGTVRSRLSRGRLLLSMKLKEFSRSYVS